MMQQERDKMRQCLIRPTPRIADAGGKEACNEIKTTLSNVHVNEMWKGGTDGPTGAKPFTAGYVYSISLVGVRGLRYTWT